MRESYLLGKEKKKKKRAADQNFAEIKQNSKKKKLIDIEEMIFATSKDVNEVTKKRGEIRGNSDAVTMSDSDDSSDSGSVNYFSDSDEGMVGSAVTASIVQSRNLAQEQKMKGYTTGDRSHHSNPGGSMSRKLHLLSSDLKDNNQQSTHPHENSGQNQPVAASKTKGYSDGVEKDREGAYDKSESRHKPYTSVYSGLYKSRNQNRSDTMSRYRRTNSLNHTEGHKKGGSDSGSSHHNSQASKPQVRAAFSDVMKVSRTGAQSCMCQLSNPPLELSHFHAQLVTTYIDQVTVTSCSSHYCLICRPHPQSR